METTPEYDKLVLISEKRNPYSPECPNRHLWSEGFRNGYKISSPSLDEIGIILKDILEHGGPNNGLFVEFNNENENNDFILDLVSAFKIELTKKLL